MDPVTITGLVVLFGVGIGGVVAGAASGKSVSPSVRLPVHAYIGRRAFDVNI